MSTVASGNLNSSALFKVYTSVGSDTDLSTAYPGQSQGRSFLPRMVLFTGGDLVVQDAQGNNSTLDSTAAGIPLPIAPQKLISSGTTATFILIGW